MDLLPELDLKSSAVQAELMLRRHIHNRQQDGGADDRHVIVPWTDMRL